MNASTSPLPASDQTLRGILLICAAVFLFASHDGLSKFLSGFYPIVMVVWARYLVHTLLLVTALSVPLLKEKVSLGQWLAVLTGFIGVLFIVRPGGALFTPAALFPLGSALCFGLYQLLTRMLANSDSPTTSNFLAGIFNTLIMSLLVPFFWQTPSLLHGLMMIALGGCGMGGHLLLTQAFRHAPPATLAPFSYGQIIFAGLLGLLVFGHVPDAWALLGILVICASGLVVAWRRGR